MAVLPLPLRPEISEADLSIVFWRTREYIGLGRCSGIMIHSLAATMSALFAKLNLADRSVIHILNTPASFGPELDALEGVKVVRGARGKVSFAIAFVITQAELDKASAALTKTADGDAVIWMAYPKGTSKKYTCEFNRDSGWKVLGNAGYEPVRMVAIDEDWSALRFRKVEYIKTLKRNPKGAISKAGKKRSAR